ncbi:ATP-binding protein [Streptomyces hygroscopicus subsp. sporocinereus]|uniref:ATP-binding protein n=1 Tax=Streptomyces hygroscopicus TaxID=1912 RepID=A0ABQ3TYX9_STRHY|nr:ATP-binding protein [Streptomyces hygroscopicus]GHJ28555.1 ATP-binding protein [Streptomyces hygroscopicus]
MSRSSRGQYDATFNVEAKRLAGVRRIVREHLHWWDIGEDAVDRVLFAINELLTNVVEHTKPDENGCRMASLLVQHVPGGVTAVVTDHDARPLMRKTASPLDESGRGLTLMRALVDESAVSMCETGKDVWFFIADPASSPPNLPEPTTGIPVALDPGSGDTATTPRPNQPGLPLGETPC